MDKNKTYDEQTISEFKKELLNKGSQPGLDSIKALMARLGDVQDKVRVIHVAGTNGKGSVCAMLASVLAEEGYKVGKYSSPAVFDANEIIQINGQNIASERYLELMHVMKRAHDEVVLAGEGDPTSFEVETALAFYYFYEEKCDYVIIETGMGGELDATNIVKKPLVSVITSISMDHTAFLGDTLEKISEAKAGIIKRGCEVVIAPQKDEVQRVLRKKADIEDASMYEADELELIAMDADGMTVNASYNGTIRNISLSLTGISQLENLACTLKVLEVLNQKGVEISEQALLVGLKNVRHRGRFETVRKDPRVILDGAHNEDAAKKLAGTLESCFGRSKHTMTFIMGVMADKDYNKILSHLLPFARKVYTITPDNPRSLPCEELAEVIKSFGVEAQSVAEGAKAALELALAASDKTDIIMAIGSLYYLKELRDVH